MSTSFTSAIILYLFPSVNFGLCSFSSFVRCKVRLCAWAFSCVLRWARVWGLASPLWGLRAMVHEQGAQVTCSSGKNNWTFVILPNYGSPVLGCGFVLIRLYLCLLLILMLFFYPFFGGDCSSVFHNFRRNYSISSCRFVVPMGRVEFRIFLLHHLEPLGCILTP